jgi:hypothetical protein
MAKLRVQLPHGIQKPGFWPKETSQIAIAFNCIGHEIHKKAHELTDSQTRGRAINLSK